MFCRMSKLLLCSTFLSALTGVPLLILQYYYTTYEPNMGDILTILTGTTINAANVHIGKGDITTNQKHDGIQ